MSESNENVDVVETPAAEVDAPKKKKKKKGSGPSAEQTNAVYTAAIYFGEDGVEKVVEALPEGVRFKAVARALKKANAVCDTYEKMDDGKVDPNIVEAASLVFDLLDVTLGQIPAPPKGKGMKLPRDRCVVRKPKSKGESTGGPTWMRVTLPEGWNWTPGQVVSVVPDYEANSLSLEVYGS